MKNIIVTGGLGFIGSNLVNKLCEDRNNHVMVIDDCSAGTMKKMNEKAKYYFRDIVDFKLDLIEKADVIIHLAARARIQPSFKNPEETMRVNVMGTIRMLELARKTGAKFVYAGSSSALSDPNINPYAASKFYGEQAVEMYSKSFELNTCIARFFNVYGPGNVMDEVQGNLLGILQKQYLNNLPFTLVEDCKEKRRDFTHVNDICEGLIRMWKTESVTNSKILNLGRGSNLSVYDVANFFIKYGKKEFKINYLPKRPGEAYTTLADLSETESMLNFKPTLNMEDYVKSWLNELDN